MKARTYPKLSKTITLGLLFVVGISLLYSFGVFSFSTLSSSATIQLAGLPSDAHIFLDDRETHTTAASLSVSPAYHSVLLARPGYFPWRKTLTLAKDETEILTPFFLPQNTSGYIVPDSDPDASAMRDAIAHTSLPDTHTKLESKNGTVALWVDGNDIYASWQSPDTIPSWFCGAHSCAPTRLIYTTIDPIRFVGFLRDRSDVIVFAIQSGLYALEIDDRPDQNFQPIYTGNDIYTAQAEDMFGYYVQDGNQLLLISP